MNKRENQSKLSRRDQMFVGCLLVPILVGPPMLGYALWSHKVHYKNPTTITAHESSGSITGTNLIVPGFDHVGTNSPDLKISIWSPTNVFPEHYIEFVVKSDQVARIEFDTSPKETNIFVLSVDSTNLVAVHPDGTVTLSNTNLDFVSSNFWKVLGQYFSDHYVLKEK